MILTSDSARSPQPAWCGKGQLRVEKDRPRNHAQVSEPCFAIQFLIGHSGDVGEFGCGKSRGNGNVWNCGTPEILGQLFDNDIGRIERAAYASEDLRFKFVFSSGDLCLVIYRDR